MTRPLARRLILAALTLSTAALAACSNPTAPTSNDDCGGVYTGVGTIAPCDTE